MAEGICQFRFPAILSIGTKEPADFQEAVRSMFPRYAVRQDQPGPKITGLGTPAAKLEPPQAITNHHFLSAYGRWKLNLTNTFISLSTVAYPGWEEFGQHFDLPLAQFIRIYQPAFFERIGLRYVNIFSRKALEVEDEPWRELFTAPYLGILSAEDVNETSARKCSVDVELNLDSTCHVKLHSGPGMLKPHTPDAPRDPEVKFILDMDLFMGGQLDPRYAAGGLETLHGHSTALFQGAITDKLHSALDPESST
ncbi:MAG: TIGR04255 family protein [Oscillospiraceae bacterium]|nr:TIGR04255 family protein [Oscillospiraceae bacterium]